MIEIRLFGDIRYKVGSPFIKIDVSREAKIKDILMDIDVGDKTLYDSVVNGDEIKEGLRILINGVDIRRLDGLDTIVKEGDTIFIGPPVVGGGMVDITPKPSVYRESLAEGYIVLKKSTISLIKANRVEKGDIVESTKIAALNAVKNTANILPYCHPIKVTGVDVEVEIFDERVKVKVLVKSIEQTGVEMEALTGVMAGLLTIWDMVKKYEKDDKGNYPDTLITDIRVVYKHKDVVGG
jgi:cyclic pyranopterin phosphate synthase